MSFTQRGLIEADQGRNLVELLENLPDSEKEFAKKIIAVVKEHAGPQAKLEAIFFSAAISNLNSPGYTCPTFALNISGKGEEAQGWFENMLYIVRKFRKTHFGVPLKYKLRAIFRMR